MTSVNSDAFRIRAIAESPIAGAELADRLWSKGGINALFLGRPLDADQVTTKTIYLVDPIIVTKGQPFTLTLRRMPDNRYEVLA